MSILDPNWRYRRDTDVQRTWRAAGWQPTTAKQRRDQQRRHPPQVIEAPELVPVSAGKVHLRLRAVGGR